MCRLNDVRGKNTKYNFLRRKLIKWGMYYLKISRKATKSTKKKNEIIFVFFVTLWETEIVLFISSDHFITVLPAVI